MLSPMRKAPLILVQHQKDTQGEGLIPSTMVLIPSLSSRLGEYGISEASDFTFGDLSGTGHRRVMLHL